ncbi:hypothetical protein HPB51_027157 [Rhipicephalus microplus]|uniref:Uncharacterized protein n=1 Tax=Rhipicephalus microplus TaxID=6941 RepID=A0A9J6D115_RHIMP|nr:hypothetical protein HPB51_027157 [Rhipicephalus microplus]
MAEFNVVDTNYSSTVVVEDGVDASGNTVIYLDLSSLVGAAGNLQDVVIVGSASDNTNISSVHSANISEVHEVPLDVITRPLPVAHYDEDKVKEIMELLEHQLTVRFANLLVTVEE